MRARITWLVVAVASAVIMSFVIPLCLLVRTMTLDRVDATARSQAQSLAVIVATVDDPHRLGDVLLQPAGRVVDAWVSLPDGTVITRSPRPQAHPELVTRARAMTTAFSARTGAGSDVLVPVVTSDGVVVVHAAVAYASVRRGVYTAWAAILALGALLLVIAVAVAGRMSKRISTPLIDLAGTAHRLRGGELSARADVAGPTEVVELGAALNQLADRIGELLGAERERAADLSHRLRTPVTALRMDAEMLDDSTARARLVEHIQSLQRAIDSVVIDARRTSREDLAQPGDAAAVVRERARHWSPLAEDEGRALRVDVPPSALVVALPTQDLADLVDNLLDNVFAHTPEGTPLAVSAGLEADGMVAVTVEDGGAGLPDRALVDRGVSGSGSSGLGLDIVERLARTGAGNVDYGTSDLGGLRVVVRLRGA